MIRSLTSKLFGSLFAKKTRFSELLKELGTEKVNSQMEEFIASPAYETVVLALETISDMASEHLKDCNPKHECSIAYGQAYASLSMFFREIVHDLSTENIEERFRGSIEEPRGPLF